MFGHKVEEQEQREDEAKWLKTEEKSSLNEEKNKMS